MGSVTGVDIGIIVPSFILVFAFLFWVARKRNQMNDRKYSHMAAKKFKLKEADIDFTAMTPTTRDIVLADLAHEKESAGKDNSSVEIAIAHGFTSTSIGETWGEPDISVPKATCLSKSPSSEHMQVNVELAILSSDNSVGLGELSDNLYLLDQSDLSFHE